MKKLVPAVIFLLAAATYTVANAISKKQTEETVPARETVVTTDEADLNEDYKTEPESFSTNVERWNKEMCVYSNFKYGFAVQLPRDVVWWLTTGTSKHTVVKFAQPHTNMVLFANIQEVDARAKDMDMWDKFEEMKQYVAKDVVSHVSNNSKETIKDLKLYKVTFCGKHALKQQYTAIVSDDRYEEPDIYYSMNYILIRDRYLYNFTVKCYKDVYDEMQKDGIRLEDWLKCFSMIPFGTD